MLLWQQPKLYYIYLNNWYIYIYESSDTDIAGIVFVSAKLFLRSWDVDDLQRITIKSLYLKYDHMWHVTYLAFDNSMMS